MLCYSQVMASLLEAWDRNGTARMAAITSTMAVVMSIEDAVAAAGGFRDGSGLAADPFWLLCLASSCKRPTHCVSTHSLRAHPHDIEHIYTFHSSSHRPCTT